MLSDLAEADGIMTAAHILPQLAAAALIEASVTEPGWAEARKIAGRPFAGVTGGMAYHDDPASLEAATLANGPRVIHALEVLMASLRGLRDDIERGDQNRVRERLVHSLEAREQWLDERGGAGWLTEGNEPVELPGLGELIKQMLVGGGFRQRSAAGGKR
jgi:hypothetical protein